MATTAIRDKILASLARYHALRIGKFPCAFWRLSARPGLTAEEIMEERGVEVDHATLNRWVTHYSPAIAVKAKSQKRETNKSWRMDETYIKVKGQWTYLYRAAGSRYFFESLFWASQPKQAAKT